MSLSEIDKMAKSLPKGLRNFVEKSLDLISLNDFYNQFRKRGGALDGYQMYYALIQWFIDLEIIFDISKVSDEYKDVKYVKDLPEKDIKDCLFYMNYILGTTIHTGGHDFFKMYTRLIESKN